jgi:hypothetical protein
MKMRSSLINDKGKNEFLHEPKDAEVSVSANLIQNPLFVVVEKRERLHLGQRFRHEWLGKVESLLAPDDVFDAPVYCV